MFEYVKNNIDGIRANIAKVCEQEKIDPEAITLIGVTKTYEADVINEAIGYGIEHIAENRVQEVVRKYDEIVRNVTWHLIGQLQTNKVKYIIDKVSLIHSVDSIKLVNEIQKRAEMIDKVQDILIQVNVANEVQKSGISVNELPELIQHVSTLKNVRVCGLMNIAPFVEDPEVLREDFKTMKRLFDSLNTYGADNVKPIYLSMGMSSDYAVAISEGANMVRIGTSIFGKRA